MAATAYGALATPSPKGVRAAVGRVLRAGVSLSSATILAGYIVALASHPAMFGSHALERAHLGARASFPHSVAAISSGIVHGNGEAIIVAGLLLLILTPVAGLLTSAVAFGRRRDWIFGVISGAVLTIIVLSFLVGWLTS